VWIDGLTEKLAAMERLYGTLSLGPCPEPGARDAGRVPFPVNGHGSLVWGVPTASGPHWYAGSTFRSDAAQHADLAQEHAANRLKLATLLPQAAHAVATQFAGGRVQAWQSERCVSHDRLPLVGPLDQGTEPTLWLSAAMGARGLSFSALCAELLVAQVCCEPLPVERTLARALDTRRPWRRKPTAHARVSAGAKAL
jgi:tRNA 5-methylaminomethyl-2-thiouridine biosynthesis bifunctional protein